LGKRGGARGVLRGLGADPEALGEQVRGTMREASEDLVGKTTVRQLVALLRRSALMVCNDSGPMHLAAAVKTPVLAFYGPTSPVRTGPYGDATRCVVLRSHEDCSPCYRKRCGRMHCMEGIGVEEAVEAAERLLDRSM